MPLCKIYTEPCIIEGGNCEVNTEHEVIKKASAIKQNQKKSIHCKHLFNPPPGQDRHIRTVITRGVPGIGKTVCANKFILDWAEERENKNLDFVFPLPFRDLNRVGDKPISLVGLINKLFPETKDTEIFKDTGILTNDQYKMLFILDGLDESLLSLDFKECEIVTDVTQPTETAVLMTNIIRGRLLPSAFIWIISQPDASSKIPFEHIDLVIEVQGFKTPQKDEYFRSIIDCQNRADEVITHVKSCESLHIMCHIPIFCWMVASLFEKKPATAGGTNMPATLTPIYIHFLTVCVDNMSKKLPGNSEAKPDSVRNDLISLGKLAFEELEKGKSIFNESSLTQNGIKVTEPTLCSGLYAQIFSEDLILCQENTFCFVHLSVQEFFAALYVYLKFNNDNENVLMKKSSISRRFLSRDSSELVLYKAAVKKALQCESGHFDIFLRFLLGLSLESNQTLVKHLLIHNRTNQKTRAEIIKYIKEKIQASPPPGRCDNLHLCLNELNDDSEMIQSYFRERMHSKQ
ncbi:NACHT%2C LRR and PYD domains-containing protein 3-like [Xyrichtys novacula]|uniref:NACHT, LRR and PYD domains-containing protein 3-like n=1 Tax=Xyrichtys novacula TaxID=13765 RepID=A0AAV1H6C3_XYRNO|nr:NACHT%2C LRR and PYD domains-containing protein 3-like [Xyrichtys novacula]